MAVVAVLPPDWEAQGATSVQVDSDAPDNRTALLEIENWSAEHAFARTSEYWLRPMLLGDRRVFRGFCFRLTDEVLSSSRELVRQREDALERTPVTSLYAAS
jgi:hypothetical protein